MLDSTKRSICEGRDFPEAVRHLPDEAVEDIRSVLLGGRPRLVACASTAPELSLALDADLRLLARTASTTQLRKLLPGFAEAVRPLVCLYLPAESSGLATGA